VQWLKGAYIDQDGNINWEAIAGATGPNLTITGALGVAGQNVTAVFTCDGSTPTPTNGTILPPVVPGRNAPANPYGPLPVYYTTIQSWYYDSTPGPAIGAFGEAPILTSFGPYGTDVVVGTFNGVQDRYNCTLWYTSGSGIKTSGGSWIEGWIVQSNGSYKPPSSLSFRWKQV
jgi:hypothetical protein